MAPVRLPAGEANDVQAPFEEGDSAMAPTSRKRISFAVASSHLVLRSGRTCTDHLNEAELRRRYPFFAGMSSGGAVLP